MIYYVIFAIVLREILLLYKLKSKSLLLYEGKRHSGYL